MINSHQQMSARGRLSTVVALLLLQAAGSSAAIGDDVGCGANPQLPKPTASLLPTVKVAKAVGWKADETPKAADGFKFGRFAAGLDHPRWLYQLPNGDVLVAESNAPPKPKDKSDGFRGWVQGLFMQRAGALTQSANRITLLRDVDGDGVAEFRSVFIGNPVSPFGMALVGQHLYVANANELSSEVGNCGCTHSMSHSHPTRMRATRLRAWN